MLSAEHFPQRVLFGHTGAVWASGVRSGGRLLGFGWLRLVLRQRGIIPLLFWSHKTGNHTCWPSGFRYCPN